MDVLFYNGVVVPITGDVCSCVGVTDKLISFVGADADGLLLASANTKKIDLGGRMLLPGFIDTHMHLTMFGERLLNVDLANAKSHQDLIDLGRQFLAVHPETPWLSGAGWNNDYWVDASFPTKEELDAVSLDIPVVYERVCGHVVTLNSRALKLCGIGSGTPDPEGGRIIRNEDGEPTGVLLENAIDLVSSHAPKPTRSDARERIFLAAKEAVSCGLTTVHSDDLSDYWEQDVAINAYRELIENEALPLRVVEQCRLYDEAHLRHFLSLGLTFSKGDERFRIGPLKLIGDGSLGARTAYLTRPYADAPETRGVPCYTQEEFDRLIGLAAENGMPAAVHSIGDATTDMVLNAIEKARAKEKTHLRHAIVHLQITRPDQLLRMKALDVMALTQPVFLDYDLHIADRRVGDLAKSSYAFRTLTSLGVHQAFGSDCPVEYCGVLRGVRFAITRQDHAGFPDGGWYPKERLSLMDALKGFTINAAYASGEEDVKGSISVGKYADLVVIDRNLFQMDPQSIDNAKIDLTMVGGKIVFEA